MDIQIGDDGDQNLISRSDQERTMTRAHSEMPRLGGGASDSGRPEEEFLQTCDEVRRLLREQYHLPFQQWAPSEILIRRCLGNQNNPRSSQEAATQLANIQGLVPLNESMLDTVRAWLNRYWHDADDVSADIIGPLSDPSEFYVAPFRVAIDLDVLPRQVHGIAGALDPEEFNIRGQLLYAGVRHNLSTYNLDFNPNFLTDLTDEDIDEEVEGNGVTSVFGVYYVARRLVEAAIRPDPKPPEPIPQSASVTATSILEESFQQQQDQTTHAEPHVTTSPTRHQQQPSGRPHLHPPTGNARRLLSPFQPRPPLNLGDDEVRHQRSGPPSPDVRQSDPRRFQGRPALDPSNPNTSQNILGVGGVAPGPAAPPPGLPTTFDPLPRGYGTGFQPQSFLRTRIPALAIPERPCHPCPTYPGQYHHACNPQTCYGIGGTISVINHNRQRLFMPPGFQHGPSRFSNDPAQGFGQPEVGRSFNDSRPPPHHGPSHGRRQRQHRLQRETIPDSADEDELETHPESFPVPPDSVTQHRKRLHQRSQTQQPADDAVESIEPSQDEDVISLSASPSARSQRSGSAKGASRGTGRGRGAQRTQDPPASGPGKSVSFQDDPVTTRSGRVVKSTSKAKDSGPSSVKTKPSGRGRGGKSTRGGRGRGK